MSNPEARNPSHPEPARQGSGEDRPMPEQRDITRGLVAQLRQARPVGQNPAQAPGPQPHVTRQQIKWIAARLQTASIEEACELSGVEAVTVLTWMQDDADFRETFANAMSDKVEGVRVLTGQMIPAALDGLYRMLESNDLKAVKSGVELLLKVHGLVDTKRGVDKGTINQLIDLLREEEPVSTMYRTIEGRKED